MPRQLDHFEFAVEGAVTDASIDFRQTGNGYFVDVCARLYIWGPVTRSTVTFSAGKCSPQSGHALTARGLTDSTLLLLDCAMSGVNVDSATRATVVIRNVTLSSLQMTSLVQN